MKRITCLLLAILMLFSFASCASKEDSGKSKKKNSDDVSAELISIPYSREDGLNPFFSSTLLNNSLMPLLYSGLYKIDATYKAQPDIASSCKVDDVRANVTINSSRRFSDGSSINADDVVYSFDLAKASIYYGSSLSGIESCAAVSNSVVEFVTTTPNKYISACLTFPIVKIKTADENDDLAVGAGPYVYTATTEGGELSPNKYYTSSSYQQDAIELKNITDTSNLNLNVVIGNVDAVFNDLASGKSERISTSSASVDLNNFVYLGLSKVGLFDDNKLRQALCKAIDKEDLLNSGFEGYGFLTEVPFNSQWYEAKDLKANTMDENDAKTYVSKQLSEYTVTILVNNDNDFKVKCAEALQKQLSSMGVESKLESVSYAVFKNGVAAGNYDIYIGEYKLTNDMNILGLISNDDLAETYLKMLSGKIKPSDFMKAFNEYQPFVPVCIRCGVLSYSKSIQGSVEPLPNNPYASLAKWYL